MSEELSLQEIKKEWHGTIKAYLIGFGSSLALTLASFSLVLARPFASPVLVVALVLLALTQAIIQIIFFLHVGEEEKPRWESLIFYFMVLVLAIVVFGTLWIMYNLNDRTMSGMAM
jgi:cytochrome o ubiquinol oxidase operon protein cyoD